ncbi:MAG: type II toxin-antitoxin system VapC family toxin [Caldilineaceae bacterium]|nr:type II toxin-antitoxin system VapC family toxin [Caldilineaceae bacterium]
MSVSPRFVLDTDHVSLLQRGNPAIVTRMQGIEPTDCAVTVITQLEQVQGRLAQIHSIKQEADAPARFRLLQATIAFYRDIIVLPYSDSAAALFFQLRQARLRIGTQDLRIASIALVTGATVITRNGRDYQQVPGLAIEDRSKPPAVSSD